MLTRNYAETLHQEMQLLVSRSPQAAINISAAEVLELVDAYLEFDRVKEALDEAIDSISILKDEASILDADLEDARWELEDLKMQGVE